MKKKEIILSLLVLIILCVVVFTNKSKLYDAKYVEPSSDLLAITIDGEISTTFPTTNEYITSVTCTTGTGSISWNGSKWVMTTSGITKGSTKCNVTFYKPFYKVILADNEVKTPITTPGAAISASNEALLASADDDYGTSYYFRGAVTNNYVEFANKCWRIVRIGGDNTVKLILHNDNTTSATSPCSAVNNEETAAFARYSGSKYTSEYNINYDDNAYVGFMYGTPGSNTYEATHANTNKSTILTNLETWYNNNLKTYESVIDDNVFCNDKSNVTDTTFNPWSFSNVTGLGYAKNETYYGATQRLVSASENAGGTGPSLKCNGDLSKITSKIGLISADELAFAGYAYYLYNEGIYLQENATGDWWWSLSPFVFDGGGAIAWNVDGALGVVDYIVGDGSVRPYISLRSSTNVTGEGTSENPYKIVS